MSSSKGWPEVEMARVHIKALEKVILTFNLVDGRLLTPLCFQHIKGAIFSISSVANSSL